MYRIFLVEDDLKLSSLTREKLENYQYIVEVVEDFSDIKSQFVDFNPDLVLMDINLPKYDGFFWCREIRRISNVPIVFLSARDSDMDQVLAIENGGDDYITKPFSFDLLLAKVKGVLRRTYGEYSDSRDLDIKEIDGLFLHRVQNIVEKDGLKLELTKKEFAILNILAKNLGSIVTRDEILMEIWDDKDFVDDNTLSVNINRLRKRLEELGIYNSIVTKRGQGYLMDRTW